MAEWTTLRKLGAWPPVSTPARVLASPLIIIRFIHDKAALAWSRFLASARLWLTWLWPLIEFVLLIPVIIVEEIRPSAAFKFAKRNWRGVLACVAFLVGVVAVVIAVRVATRNEPLLHLLKRKLLNS